MATFTYTPWVTGEVITANKLNSHNCKLVVTQEDLDNDFEITIPTGLSAEDFFEMMVKIDNNISKIRNVNLSSLSDGWLTFFVGFDFYYDPTTGTLQSTNPNDGREEL